MSMQTGFSTRIGDHPLALGMKRYEDSEKNSLWVFTITKYCGGDPLVRIPDPSVQDLVKMRQAIDECIETLRFDGGRLEKEAAQ